MRSLTSYNSKFTVVGVTLIVVLALFLLICPSKSCAADLELLVPGQLSAATEGTYPPYSMADAKGDIYGLEVSVIKEISRRIGLKYEPVRMKWESILIGLLAGQYDMSSATMSITAERQQKVTYGDAWLESGSRLVVRNDSLIRTKGDFKGKTVGVLVASTWVPLAEALGAREVKYYKSDSDAIQDVINKNVDGVIEDAITISYAIKESKLPLRVLDEYLDRDQRGMAFKKGKPNLVKAYNKALADMIADGTYAKIATEIVGFDPHPKDPTRSILE